MKSSVVQTFTFAMPMMLQDGPSKRRRNSGGKKTPQILPYSTSPMPWLPPMYGVNTEHIMPRPPMMSRSKSRLG